MKRTKRIMISMIVFLSVFNLSAIIYAPTLINTDQKADSSKEAAILLPETETVAENIEIQSFAYRSDISAEETLQPTESQNILSNQTDINTINSITPTIAEEVTKPQKPDSTTEALTISEVETAPLEAKEKKAEEATDTTKEGTNKSEVAIQDKTKKPESAISDKNKETEPAIQDTAKAESAIPDKSKETEPAIQAKKEEPALYSDIAISIAKDYVNIREKASTDGEVVGKLYKNAAAQIIKKDGDWYLVESGTVKGYIRSDFLKTGISDKELIANYSELRINVAVDGLNVREKPDTESKKVTVIYKNETYPALEVKGEWIKVDITDDNVKGYVKSEFADLIVDFPDAVSKEEEQELQKLEAEARAKKETEIKKQESVSYSKEDLRLLACLVHAEAGTQSYEGKLAVANIVLNRVKSPKYANSIKAVIYQKGQFSVAYSGSMEKQLASYSHYSNQSQLLSIKAAKAALEGSNNIGSRLYFHSYKAAVKKGYDSKSTAVKLGDHLFW